MDKYEEVLKHRNSQWQVERTIEDILSAIARMCDLLDRGETVASVSRRIGLAEAKVRKVYRIRNRRMRSALDNFYAEVLTPVKVAPRNASPRGARRVEGVISPRGKGKKYVANLINELHGGAS